MRMRSSTLSTGTEYTMLSDEGGAFFLQHQLPEPFRIAKPGAFLHPAGSPLILLSGPVSEIQGMTLLHQEW